MEPFTVTFRFIILPKKCSQNEVGSLNPSSQTFMNQHNNDDKITKNMNFTLNEQ